MEHTTGSGTVTTWSAFAAAEPELATTVRERFGQFTHHALATLRKDGSPRLSGIEADFRWDELWLGMMPNSRKALDLRRDPRFSLLANPGAGTDMGGGDVRISGRAVEITDPETLERYAEEVGMPMPFHVFRVEPTEVVRTYVEGDDMVIRSWRPGRAVRTMRRGTDDSPPREES
ncbi:pyridoxamine 5'-phosphate oxidase family protein [Streptomyces sp. P9(2023)]|uniref:pyridoxamine 5'-phosphate oxidase family protein n=1 Tax=Streptomyces sp. P9(2023) TaxID=3064394 RepID=UPI0028F41FCD|nr:pyridoxamine 5'-phosphate oxidase family protein [Streptomyces sp. P9(2023)]MDT9687854.1 pyridoxamine 5'-phosphate oxidase family protein [Streptomyces sp. P9(2023)]